jgi:hypothetical protein
VTAGWVWIWEKCEERGLRREAVNVMLAGIDVVVEAGRSNRTCRREVVGVRYREWLQPFLTER